jgi:cell division transport system permease protein
MTALRFSAEEASLSLWRRRRSNLLSLLTITVAMFVLGGFLLVNTNVQRWIGQWTSAAELSVYLTDAVTAEERRTIERVLSAHAVVAGADFVSHAEAVRRFRTLFPDLAETAAQLGDRPLPASYEVRLRPEGASDEAVEALSAALRTQPGVADVRYDRRWIARLMSLAETGRAAGALLAAVLIVAAALSVASVIRLAMHAREQEVEIMHLVGAPLAFIRGPFVLEGVLQGGLGALAALVLLYGLHVAARARLGEGLAGLSGPGPALAFLPWTAALGLVAGGMLVGCVGGFIASRSAR